MSERIITLFGEEIVPEQLKAIGRSRAKKKVDEKADETAGNEVKLEEAIEAAQTIVAPANSDAQPTAITMEAPTALAHEGTPIAALPGETAEAIVPEVAIATEVPATELAASATETEPQIINEVAEEPQEAEAVVKEVVKKEKPTPAILPDDWQGTKQYYSIGEVADLFKVKTSHIRFWTNEFKLKVRTTRKGDRLYTPEQIKELRAINNLVKERGFTLKGAKSRLKATEKMEVETVDLKQSLLHLRNKLVAIKNQLK